MKITVEENEIIDYVENDKTKSVANVKDEISKYTMMAQEYATKKKAISLRLPESDIYILKQKALASGLSYQNIIQSLVHQYAHNQLKVAL